ASGGGGRRVADVSARVWGGRPREPGRTRRVALGPGLNGSGLHRSLGNEGTSLDVGDLGHQVLAEFGGGLELGGIRGTADDLARLRLQSEELALELGYLVAALTALRLQALAACACVCCRGGKRTEARFGVRELRLGLIVCGERLLLKVGRQTRRGGERGELRFQVLQRLLGLGDQRFLAR